MNLYQVVIFWAVGISFVLGGNEAHSITKLLSECTEKTKEMHIDSDISMSAKYAKHLLVNLGKISKISESPDKSERKAQWKKYPELKVLKTEINNLTEVFSLPPDESDKILKSNEGMQKTVAKLSLLDPANRKSPLKGKNIKKYLNRGSKSVESTFKRGELKIKQIFKKLIPPSPSH